MPILEAEFGSALPVDGYGPGVFRVAGKLIRGAIVIEAGGVSAWGGYDDRATLAGLAGKVELLFVGTGQEIAYLPKDFVADLEALGIFCEAMASPSAARTYNVLLSEGRRVAAALLPLPEAP